MIIERTSDGFILIGTNTIIAHFTTLDGEPAVAFREPDEQYYTYFTTNHRRGLACIAYHVLRHAARWKPEIEW